MDIAWFIYVNRLGLAGYPIGRLHPNLGKCYERIEQMREIAKDIELPPPVRKKFVATRAQHLAEGMHLEAVAGLSATFSKGYPTPWSQRLQLLGNL